MAVIFLITSLFHELQTTLSMRDVEEFHNVTVHGFRYGTRYYRKSIQELMIDILAKIFGVFNVYMLNYAFQERKHYCEPDNILHRCIEE